MPMTKEKECKHPADFIVNLGQPFCLRCGSKVGITQQRLSNKQGYDYFLESQQYYQKLSDEERAKNYLGSYLNVEKGLFI
jgi:hypothetical protein